jgi:hypothetical protein
LVEKPGHVYLICASFHLVEKPGHVYLICASFHLVEKPGADNPTISSR